jgi:hypothetical protein
MIGWVTFRQSGSASMVETGAMQCATLIATCALRETRMDAPNVYFSPGASTTAASVVSSRKVKVSCKYSSTIVLEWLE